MLHCMKFVAFVTTMQYHFVFAISLIPAKTLLRSILPFSHCLPYCGSRTPHALQD